jgi:hypothetical protein
MLSKKQRLQINQEIILVEVGYCNDTLQLNKIEQKHHQHIGLVQALSMAGFQVAFAKVVHCIPLGFGGTVFRNLHALLCSFQVPSAIVQNLSYRLSAHAISFSHSIYLTRRRLESSVAKKRYRLIALFIMGDQKWPPYYAQAFFLYC